MASFKSQPNSWLVLKGYRNASFLPKPVLDLPQLYQKPSALILLDVLDSLKRTPRSWKPIIPSKDQNESHYQVDESNPKIVSKYLTSIIASPLNWLQDEDQKECIWEEASSRLAERSGRTGMSSIDRNFEILIKTDPVSISLHEPALTSDNLGLKTWAASYVLAQRFEQILHSELLKSKPSKILELGAGTGLVGIAAALVFSTTVCLTDLPEIEFNLRRNITNNQSLVNSYGGKTISGVLDWTQPETLSISENQLSSHDLITPHSYPLIVAADSVYSTEHPPMLAQTVKYWLSREPESRVLLELPFRTGFEDEMQLMKSCMIEAGFVLLEEAEDFGHDDWGSSTSDEDSQVKCWFSAWSWQR